MEKIDHLNSKGNSQVRNMLSDLYGIFLKKFSDTQKSWDYFLEFIATDNSAEMIFQGEHNIKWLFDDKRFRDSVFSVYDSNLLKSIYYDHLGEFYFELIEKQQFEKTLPDKILTQIKIQCNGQKKSVKVIDLDMGTGRRLLAIHKLFPNTILFGVTNDLNHFRIALTNSLLFGIKCYLLHADKTKHELGLNNSRGLENWKHANQWGIDIDKLLQNLN